MLALGFLLKEATRYEVRMLLLLIGGVVISVWLLGLGRRSRIVWVNEGRPAELGRLLRHNIKVAGISQPMPKVAAAQFLSKESSECCLSLERDPANEFDRHAIKVIGTWRDARGIAHKAQLGWVPREDAREIAREVPEGPLGASLQGFFPPKLGRNPGIRMDIWTAKRIHTRRSNISQSPIPRTPPD